MTVVATGVGQNMGRVATGLESKGLRESSLKAYVTVRGENH